jgi:hypothetical protein
MTQTNSTPHSNETTERKMDMLDAIMTISGGECTEDEYIEAFQFLIDSGAVWNLEGYFGRTANVLIKAGHCHA